MQDLTEKEVASTFWNGEVEVECRELGCLDFFGLYKHDGDREKVMKKIDSIRLVNYSIFLLNSNTFVVVIKDILHTVKIKKGNLLTFWTLVFQSSLL